MQTPAAGVPGPGRLPYRVQHDSLPLIDIASSVDRTAIPDNDAECQSINVAAITQHVAGTRVIAGRLSISIKASSMKLR